MDELDTQNQGQTVYEIGYLVLPSVAEDKLGEVTDALKDLIAKEGGKEIDGEAPIKQDLAYTMTKTIGASRYVVNDAYIGWIKFELEAGKVNGLKTKVEALPEILRFLLVKAPRETGFTFAEAMKAQEESEAPETAEGEVTPTTEEVVVE